MTAAIWGARKREEQVTFPAKRGLIRIDGRIHPRVSPCSQEGFQCDFCSCLSLLV